MATSPTRLEADLMAYLGTAFAPIKVAAWPDDIERHQLRGEAEILVGYRGGPWNPPPPSHSHQERTVHLEIGLACKSMAGHQGSTALLERIAQAVLGHRLPEARPMAIVEDRYLGRAPGVWWYALKVAIPGVVALPAPPPPDPPITRITVHDGPDALEIP